MSKHYDVIIRIPSTKLGVVIETLDGEGELLSVNPAGVAPEKRKRVPHRVGRPTNGVRGEDLILGRAAGGADVTYKQFGDHYEKHGLMAKSISPMISKLIAAKRLVRVRHRVYKIAPK